MTPVDRDRVILAKTAWSERYQGLGTGDDPVGSHDYLGYGSGHEAFNFKRAPDGRFYGDFHFRGHLNLSRIDNRATASKIHGITVLWVSTPGVGGLRMVGWYRNATLFATTQKSGGPWSHILYGDGKGAEGKCHYMCTASADESFCLPVSERPRWILPEDVASRMRRTAVLHPHDADGHLAPWVSQMEHLISRVENFVSKQILSPRSRVTRRRESE